MQNTVGQDVWLNLGKAIVELEKKHRLNLEAQTLPKTETVDYYQSQNKLTHTNTCRRVYDGVIFSSNKLGIQLTFVANTDAPVHEKAQTCHNKT